MILNIEKYPSKILFNPTKKVEVIDNGIKKLISDMAETMQANKGCGLAAPQVGTGLRLAVVDDGGRILTLINPEITKFSPETEIIEEGCLSLPQVEVKVRRSSWVELKILDLEGKEINFKAEGILARIIQHEVDHLGGRLILDRVNFFIRRRLIKKLIKDI